MKSSKERLWEFVTGLSEEEASLLLRYIREHWKSAAVDPGFLPAGPAPQLHRTTDERVLRPAGSSGGRAGEGEGLCGGGLYCG